MDMAARAAAGTAVEERPMLKTAEAWADEKHVPGEYLAGMVYGNRWGKGKTMTEKEFDVALKGFLSSPADGRKR